jgi:hypothetical protein
MERLHTELNELRLVPRKLVCEVVTNQMGGRGGGGDGWEAQLRNGVGLN